ncbi:hypothetical protein LSCM1_05351 [Leishmania martiniquensis]|uniref:Uncharacterized protein n=1 Tax=Leishmania martiniquensis TaxID=1580590 RepID=A0A836H057_9TRYP|nr:hypothetical protein LSCM1_05351 [Leishmania martiniquensis]
MYATATTVHRTRRPYPPPDDSKHYTEVPPATVKQYNPIFRAIKRLGVDFGIMDLDAGERVAVFIAATLLVALFIGGPIYIVRYAFS